MADSQSAKGQELEDTLTQLQAMSSRDVLTRASQPAYVSPLNDTGVYLSDPKTLAARAAGNQGSYIDTAQAAQQEASNPLLNWVTGGQEYEAAANKDYLLAQQAQRKIEMNKQAQLYSLMLNPAYSDPWHPAHEQAKAAVYQHIGIGNGDY